MAHRIFRYEGRCGNFHGHTYHAELMVKGTPDPDTGMVMDFSQIKKAMYALVDDVLDHASLLYIEDPLIEAINPYTTKMGILNVNTTAENLAQFLFNEWSKTFGEDMVEVRLWETPTSLAVANKVDPEVKMLFHTRNGQNFDRPDNFPADLLWLRPQKEI